MKIKSKAHASIEAAVAILIIVLVAFVSTAGYRYYKCRSRLAELDFGMNHICDTMSLDDAHIFMDAVERDIPLSW